MVTWYTTTTTEADTVKNQLGGGDREEKPIVKSCAYKAQFMLYDLSKAFARIESRHKLDSFLLGKHIYSFMRAQHALSYHLI